MINQFPKLFLLLLFLIHLASCANISSPSGGPKDVTAPKVVKEKSYPLPNTLNFKGRVIELTFDENVAPHSLQEQLLITPLEENPYKIIPRKNKIRLEFEKEFSPNTTYTFNFREGIKDITENNTASDLIIPFSTGPYIDSISAGGKVLNIQNEQPLENTLVSLYRNRDTLTPLNSKPLYFTKSNKDGRFFIQNIKTGNYDLYAFDDKNKNLKYEETEIMDYMKNVSLDSSKLKLEFKLARYDNTPPKVTHTKQAEGIVEIHFNEGLQTVQLQGENKNDLIYNSNPSANTIYVYDIFNKPDSIPVTIQATDSSGNSLAKNIKILFKKDKEVKSSGLSTQYLPSDRQLTPKKYSISLKFNRPLTKYLLDQLIIIEDTVKQKLKPDAFEWVNKTTLKITKETKAKDSVLVIIPEKTFAFLAIENKADTVKYTIKGEEDYGSISGTVQTKEPSYILELLDDHYKQIEKLVNPTNFNFTNINPGSYYLRIIEDENKNGKWDSGNIKENKQPENIYMFKDKIDLRANWEVEGILFKF